MARVGRIRIGRSAGFDQMLPRHEHRKAQEEPDSPAASSACTS